MCLRQPAIGVALGVTAARGVLGRSVTISKVRGEILAGDDGGRILVTVHPSSLLRIEEDEERAQAYRGFVTDLRVCAQALERLERQQPLKGAPEGRR